MGLQKVLPFWAKPNCGKRRNINQIFFISRDVKLLTQIYKKLECCYHLKLKKYLKAEVNSGFVDCRCFNSSANDLKIILILN
jgi:hypothetical protein